MNKTIEMNVDAALDRKIAWRRGGSVRYLVAEAGVEDLAAVDQASRDLAIGLVIDASGSMQGPRIDAAKKAALMIVEKLTDGDHISIVSFDEHAKLLVEGVRCDREGSKKAKEAINGLDTGTTTNLSGGWLLGAQEAAKAAQLVDGPIHGHVIVLSDGHANQGILDPTEIAGHAAELMSRGLTSSTVGIGDDYSPVHLQAIADSGGGRMHDAERPEEIIEVVIADDKGWVPFSN